MEVRGKKVAVIGLGTSGLNAALLLKGAGARPFASDSQDTASVRENASILIEKGIDVELGGHTEKFLAGSELVIVSPGVEDDSPAIRWAKEKRVPVMGEMELGCRFCRGRIIAITGTNGKSTVTALTGEILKAAGKETVICGNIGNPLSGEIGRIREDTLVVMEVSSFQLERTELFRPWISVILNVTDDHMDRYRTFEEYYREKARIFRNQKKGDWLILNYDAENLRRLEAEAQCETLFYSRFNKANGAYIEGCEIFCGPGARSRRVASIGDIRLKGTHNVENVLASVLAAALAGASEGAIKSALKSFKGLAHRFETVGAIDGVEYIDDSKATTVDSTRRALESCERPVVLIAGGRDKNSDYSSIRETAGRKVRHLVLIGEAASNIKKALGEAVETHEAEDMDAAVKMASRLAAGSWAVLLSPMCSSFDMFRDYKERGEAFRRAVENLRVDRKARAGIG